jgi:hypothetical protein
MEIIPRSDCWQLDRLPGGALEYCAGFTFVKDLIPGQIQRKKVIGNNMFKGMKNNLHNGLSMRRRRLAVRLFHINLQLYFVVVAFVGLFYSARVVSFVYWPFYATAGWGVLLILQFIWISRRRQKGSGGA